MNTTLSFSTKVNAAGAVVFAIIGGYVIYEVARSRAATPCGGRYGVVKQFSLKTSAGAPLQAAELQARAGASERGVMEKATVLKVEGGPAPLAMDVRLGGKDDDLSGISFTWTPPGLGKVTAACLNYNAFLPEAFEFAQGGQLPGLYGGVTQRIDDVNGFTTRFNWHDRGIAGVEVALPRPDDGFPVDPQRYRSERTTVPRGRWVQIEQEVVLNTPKASDGILRLWIDGKLKVEDRGVVWRSQKDQMIAGTTVDVGYFSVVAPLSSKKSTGVKISALQMSW